MNDVLFLGRMTGCDLIFSGLPHMPLSGQETFCNQFDIKIGGSANTPIAARRLGVNAKLFTEIGNDLLGTFLMNELKKENIDTTFVKQIDGFNTCVSAVLSTTTERGFATYAECGNWFTTANIKNAINKTEYLYTDLEHCMNDGIDQIAKDAGAKLIIDASWGENFNLEKACKVLDNCFLFTVNDLEAQHITNQKDPYFALDLFAKHAENTVIKLGAKGCIAKSQDTIYKSEGIKNIDVVDTTGAGDAFGAGLLYGFLNNLDMQESLNIANAAGALTVTFAGGSGDIFTLENVLKLSQTIL